MGRRLRHKVCLTIRYEATWTTLVYIKYEFHTIKQITFPKRKEPAYNEVLILYFSSED